MTDLFFLSLFSPAVRALSPREYSSLVKAIAGSEQPPPRAEDTMIAGKSPPKMPTTAAVIEMSTRRSSRDYEHPILR